MTWSAIFGKSVSHTCLETGAAAIVPYWRVSCRGRNINYRYLGIFIQSCRKVKKICIVKGPSDRPDKRSSILRCSAENLTPSRLVDEYFCIHLCRGIAIRTATGHTLPGIRSIPVLLQRIIAGDLTSRPFTAIRNRCRFCFTSFGKRDKTGHNGIAILAPNRSSSPHQTGRVPGKISERSDPPWVENFSIPFTIPEGDA